MHYLGIDLGTSSVKVIAMALDGTITAEASCDYPLSYPKANWAEQNPGDWWQGTVTAIKDLLANAPELGKTIAAIGFSGQMHGLVALNQEGEVLTPAILWCDQRTQSECDDLTNYFSFQGLGDLVANQALTGFTAPKLLWLKRHLPAIFSQIKHILLPKDYIRYRLTGLFATDYSDASGSLLLDVQNKCWSQPICDYIGISADVLPTLVESYQPTGFVKSEVANELGLSGEILVVGGAGDQAAGAIGTGAVKPGILSVALGTSGVVFAPHQSFEKDSQLRLHAFCDASGKYHSMGVMLSAASSLKWWQEALQIADVTMMTKEAESVEASEEGLFFLPYLMGERTPYADPHAKGSFIGMTTTTTRAMLTRAVLEGVAFGLKDSLDILTSMGVPITSIRLIGGGAKSHLWRQIVADVFGYPIESINTEQGGALGACILAAVGAGAFPSVQEACNQIIKTTEVIQPNLTKHQGYKEDHKRYKALYKCLEPWFKQTESL